MRTMQSTVWGLMLGHQAQQKRLLELAQQLVDEDGASQDLKDAAKAWIDSVNDAALSKEASKTFVVELEKSDLAAAKEILANKSFLTKKSFWIFGGDGWAYDIGFGGLDHVLASGEDINVFVFDTEVYSNTGGQSSKASRLGQVAQFAAAGKDIKQKNLAEIAMTYGYVYVLRFPWAQTSSRLSRQLLSRGLSRTIPHHRLLPMRDGTPSRAAWLTHRRR